MASNLSPEQQVAFDAVREKINYLEKTIGESLNLQANGGYFVRNELINMRTLLDRVEAAPAGTSTGGGSEA